MAEAFAKKRFGDTVIVESAGIRPQTSAQAADAVYTLKALGINASSHVPRNVAHLDLSAYSVVVALEKRVARVLAETTDRLVITWDVKDPYGDDLEEYRQCAFAVKRLVKALEVAIV